MFSMRDDNLWQAVTSRDLATVQQLVAQGADVNMLCGDGWVRKECAGGKGTGKGLLHHAAYVGDFEIFKFLVEQGADVGRKRNTFWRKDVETMHALANEG